MPYVPGVAGIVALAICESLLLALNDRNILPEREIVGMIQDTAAACADRAAHDGQETTHKAVAALINGILAGGKPVQRRQGFARHARNAARNHG